MFAVARSSQKQVGLLLFDSSLLRSPCLCLKERGLQSAGASAHLTTFAVARSSQKQVGLLLFDASLLRSPCLCLKERGLSPPERPHTSRCSPSPEAAKSKSDCSFLIRPYFDRLAFALRSADFSPQERPHTS